MNNNDNNTYRYPDNVAINSLDIADSLKELGSAVYDISNANLRVGNSIT
jgi:hypothetical protein